MYLFTDYVFRESVDSAHSSQISSTFQEADCLLKLVKVNKRVFAITLLSRNLNHTAQLSISARGGGGIIILSVGLGGGEETEKTPFRFYKSKEILVFLNDISNDKKVLLSWSFDKQTKLNGMGETHCIPNYYTNGFKLEVFSHLFHVHSMNSTADKCNIQQKCRDTGSQKLKKLKLLPPYSTFHLLFS